MRLKFFPMIASALMLGACPIAKADSVIEIHPFGSGSEVETVAISKDLKKRGMTFVGSVTIYSYLQAIGVIYSHDEECHLYKKPLL